MRLRGLVFERFGPFERAEVDFCDASGVPLDVVLFVGESGSGKSTLLRGISGLLSEAAGAGEELREDQIRRNANLARCRVVFDDRVDDERLVVTLEKELPGSGLKTLPATAFHRWKRAIEREPSARAAFSVTPESDEHVGGEDEPDDDPLVQWFTDLRDTPSWPTGKSALEHVIRPYRFSRATDGDLVFDTGSGFGTSSELGEGFTSVLVMVLELLRLSIDSEAEELVYVIDDIDAHLHPRLAARLLHDLRRAFPRVQLVATTHSPYVVASVEPHQVYRLGNPRLAERLSDAIPKGAMTTSVNDLAFGVPGLVGPHWLQSPPATARREVLALFDEVLGHGAVAYALPEPVHARDVKNAFGEPVISAEGIGTGYVFFIDLEPGVPWGHPCEYVFRARDGQLTRQPSIWPPVALPRFIPADTHSEIRPPVSSVPPAPPTATVPPSRVTPQVSVSAFPSEAPPRSRHGTAPATKTPSVPPPTAEAAPVPPPPMPPPPPEEPAPTHVTPPPAPPPPAPAPAFKAASCRAAIGNVTKASTYRVTDLQLRGTEAAWTSCAKSTFKERTQLSTVVHLHFVERSVRSATCPACPRELATCIDKVTRSTAAMNVRPSDQTGEPEYDVSVAFTCD